MNVKYSCAELGIENPYNTFVLAAIGKKVL